MWKFTAKVFYLLFNPFYYDRIKFIDIIALLIKVVIDFRILELILFGIIAILLFLTTIIVFIFTAITINLTIGRRLPTAILFCGPCLLVLAFIVIYIFIPPNY